MESVKKEPSYIESFKALFREKKYPHAFIIASKYPMLKELQEYAMMQKHFHTLLKLSALYIKKGEKQKAKELIGEYARIEEKRIVVKLLLSYGEEFLDFIKMVSDIKIEEAFATVQNYPEFANLPSFIALKAQMQKRVAMLEEKMDAMRLQEDFSLLYEWESFLEEAKRAKKRLLQLQKLQNFYAKAQWQKCYEMIEEDPLVQNSLLAQQLKKHWYSCYEKAKLSAEDGDIEGVYKNLKDFLSIQSKKSTIKELLYIASKRAIAVLIEQRELQKAQKLLFDAVEYFGKKRELIELSELYFQQSGIKVVFT
ncbi:WD-40 repeat [hydrothermal vent metagenome]|uniref:WD-40 repeat n=1 Tax=hydrothermal vent metagenome TaxID=652676 RepID=A0A1W1BBX8_9ZZZZ